MAVCFTFDVELHDQIEAATDYVCPEPLRSEYARRMEDCTRWLLKALAEVGGQATFFVVGQIARTHPQLIRDLIGAGHEVGCHSLNHQRLHRLTPAEFRADLREAKALLEDAAGTAVVGYRAPTFSITRETAWAIDVLAEEGMQYDSSIFPVRHDRYGVPDAPRLTFRVIGRKRSLLELPLATLRIASLNLPAAGGGYFRLFPPAVMRAAIRQIEGDPAGVSVLYFHPWEFDSTQPRLPLGKLNKFRTYVGIRRGRGRLKSLLARYGSMRMIDAVGKFDSGAVEPPVFRLGPPQYGVAGSPVP
jgi:polysaccharide deacetylase family protein (PEP-CTERM system associated)